MYNFMLDEHEKEGYTEMIPPYIVNAASMYGTSQFPKFKEDVYQVNGEDMTLIPTAEVPLTNYYRDEVIPARAVTGLRNGAGHRVSGQKPGVLAGIPGD